MRRVCGEKRGLAEGCREKAKEFLPVGANIMHYLTYLKIARICAFSVDPREIAGVAGVKRKYKQKVWDI